MSTARMSEEAQPTSGPPKNVVTGAIKAMRPRQWVKNLLVLVEPMAALGGGGVLDVAHVSVDHVEGIAGDHFAEVGNPALIGGDLGGDVGEVLIGIAGGEDLVI